ncbi:MAG TPA: TolC family protein, partial [Xanthobacteraceae bacterium]|nr:TolC family protein [Xanthobacteraceae bacterium]
GAMNKLDQAREHVFYAEVSAQLATAQQRITSERERLIRALGLWGSDLGFRLPNALPALPPRIQALPTVEVEAVRQRVDLRIARIELDLIAKSARLTQATRFLNLLELAGISKTTRGAGSPLVHARGVEAEFQIPLFDFGEARVRQAEEAYRGALHRLAEKAVNARSEAREAYVAYRSSYEIAVHYQREILPLRKIIAEETQLRYGAMQIDDFALLVEARQRLAAIAAAIEAKRDFWLRKTDVLNAVLGGAATASNEAPAPMSAPESRAGGH